MSSSTRFSPYTDTNHQAPLWIATSLTLTYAGVFFLARMFMKFKLLSWDDLVLALANLFGLVQWCLLYAALDVGVGRVVSGPAQLMQGARLIFASRIFTLLAIGLAKCSVVLFLRQIFSRTTANHLRICYIMLAASAAWTVISPMIVSIGCRPSAALNIAGLASCPGDTTRWWVVTGVDTFLEVCLIIMPIYLFNSIQIRRSQKIQLAIAFSFRLGVPGLFIAYAHAYSHFRLHDDSTLGAVTPLTLQQALCGYGLISATTPSLKNFLARFFTDGAANIVSSHEYSATRSGTRVTANHALQSLDRKGRVVSINGAQDSQYEATAYAVPAISNKSKGSADSFGSEQIMIQRNVEYYVTDGSHGVP